MAIPGQPADFAEAGQSRRDFGFALTQDGLCWNTMSTAPRYTPQYTVSDYRQWEGRWELLAGVAIAMSPSPTGRHAELLGRFVMALGNAIEAASCAATVLVEIDWIVASDTVVRPDVTVVCGPAPAGHVEKPPALVVEILSAATRDRDLAVKRAIYEEEGVPLYLIADPDERTVQVLTLDPEGRYGGQTFDASAGDVSLALCDECRLTIEPARLLRSDR
jgi:Uma2 family endonuclease